MNNASICLNTACPSHSAIHREIFVSCRFSIPQKLSKSTLSLPCSHRMITSVPPVDPLSSVSRILKPNAGSASSSPSSRAFCGLGTELSELSCCRFRLAALDHTSHFAKPTPVARAGRYRHWRFRSCRILFRFRAQASKGF